MFSAVSRHNSPTTGLAASDPNGYRSEEAQVVLKTESHDFTRLEIKSILELDTAGIKNESIKDDIKCYLAIRTMRSEIEPLFLLCYLHDRFSARYDMTIGYKLTLSRTGMSHDLQLKINDHIVYKIPLSQLNARFLRHLDFAHNLGESIANLVVMHEMNSDGSEPIPMNIVLLLLTKSYDDYLQQRSRNIIGRTIVKYMDRRKLESSYDLRIILSNPKNGVCVTDISEIKPNDIIVVAPENYGYPRLMHGFILVITSLEPMIADIYELTVPNRVGISKQQIGKELTFSEKLRDKLLPFAFYIRRDIVLEKDKMKDITVLQSISSYIPFKVVFKLHVTQTHLDQAFKDEYDQKVSSMKKLALSDKQELVSIPYGLYRCNNVVAGTVAKALKYRNKENTQKNS